MKNFFFFLFFFATLFSTSVAQSMTDAESSCLQSGGELLALSQDKPEPLQLVFCYFGFSGMEVQTFYRSQNLPWGGPQAHQAYRATEQFDGEACSRQGGKRVSLRDKHNNKKQICLFSDRSAIDLQTLEAGTESPFNEELNEALGIDRRT